MLFRSAEGINNIHTLSDYKFSKFGLEYGFLVKENQLLARGVVVIGKSGVVKYVEITKDITIEPDYELAIAAVKALL